MRRLRQLRDNDAGVTLVELSVVIVIMGMLGAMLSTWFITTQRTTTTFTTRITDLNDARTALDRMTRDIRMAISPSAGVTAFDPTSSGTTVTMYVNEPAAPPSRVTYSLAPNANGTTRLVRTITPGTGALPPYTWATASTRSQVLANRLSQGSTLLFSYYDVASSSDPTCGAGITPPCSTPMVATPTITDAQGVGAVEVVLRTKSGNATGPTELRTRVRVVNTNLVAIV